MKFADQILSLSTRNDISEIRKSFLTASPFKHTSIDNFFEPDFCQALLREFPKVENVQELKNEFGGKSRKATRPDVRNLGESYRKLDEYLQSPEWLNLMTEITGIENLVYDPEYHGGGTHENLDGQGMDTHIDFNYHRTTGYDRRLNAIIYFNDQWEESWGGCIDLHSDPWIAENDEMRRILPLMNRCVIFETNEVSWHGFDKIKLPEGKKDISRRSFAIYLYTNGRPAEERAVKHSTIYVQPPLSNKFVAGYTLGQRDVDELKSNFEVRNNYLKALYKRETRFEETIAELRSQVEKFKASLQLPISGYVKQVPQSLTGMYADRWVGERINCKLQAERKVKSVTFTGFMPKFAAEDNRVTLSVENQSTAVTPIVGSEFQLTLDLQFGPEAEFNFTIEASSTRKPLTGDNRDLGFYICAVTFEHKD